MINAVSVLNKWMATLYKVEPSLAPSLQSLFRKHNPPNHTILRENLSQSGPYSKIFLLKLTVSPSLLLCQLQQVRKLQTFRE